MGDGTCCREAGEPRLDAHAKVLPRQSRGSSDDGDATMAESPSSKKRASERPPAPAKDTRRPPPSIDELLEGLTRPRAERDA